MRTRNWWLLGLFGLLIASRMAYPLSGNTVARDNVKARFVSETAGIGAGQTIWVALEFEIRDGWHTYWRNPGDSGEATSVAWNLPPGFSAGAIVWPTPHRFELPPLVNYGYSKHAVHLVPITAPKYLKPGSTARLQGKASWLVCADVCIPEGAALTLDLPVRGAATPIDPAAAALFAAARADLPNPAPAATGARLQNGRLVITLGSAWGPALSQIESLAYFPYDEGSIEYGAPQILTRSRDALELAVKAGYQPPQGGTVSGVLIATEKTGDGTATVPIEIAAALGGAADAGAAGATTGTSGALAAPSRQSPSSPPSVSAPHSQSAPPALSARPGLSSPQSRSAQPSPSSAAPSSAPPSVSAPLSPSSLPFASPPSQRSPPSLPALILLAVLGGLILNLMPCVFPVLSIKAIGLVDQAKRHPAAVRAKGLVFAAGVVSSMLSLAAVLLALRAGGEEIGWGFQLQSPLFVTLMVYLLLAVGLNLSGVFEVGGGLAGVGDGLTRGDGYRAAFFTGVLTTLVATPCTAPFMAAAVGAALTQSPTVALVIFASLGVGLSLPYLTLSFAPWMRRALPKPGAWMETMKQIFAFPMYSSAAWLLWVLAQQTSSLGLGAALAGAILIALAAWAYQKSKGSGLGGRVTAIVTAAAALSLALLLPLRFANVAAASTGAAASLGAASSSGAATSSGAMASPAAAASPGANEAWEPYDAARAAQITAAGRPLLVNFTASWCLTCLVNERNAFADSAVQQVLREKGVALMKGDWTNRDPAITAALSTFGRAGVPLYVVYNAIPGSSEPLVLPQLLTANIVNGAFARLPDRNLK